MRGWLGDTAAALSFFTRLPLPEAAHAMPLAEATRAIPIAALVAALPSALVLVLLAPIDRMVAAIAATAVLAAVTGALHEDGFADVADGFWGGVTPERRLEIMRDSRLGTFGVVALVLALIAKVALLTALLGHGVFLSASALVVAAIIARTMAVFVWISTPSARPDGLAAHRPTRAGSVVAACIAAGVSVILMVWQSAGGTLLATICLVLTAIGVALLARQKIGGVTGDVIGAAIVAGDLAYLAGLVIWLGPSTHT